MTTTTLPGGATTQNSYDSNGNVTQFIDENGNGTYNSYDQLNRLMNTTDVLGNQQQFTYDEVGNRTQVTDANGCNTNFTYDGLNRLLTTVHDYGTAAAATITNTYDGMNLVARTDALSQETSYYYDPLNRLQIVEYPVSADTLYYSRNDVGNVTAVGLPYYGSTLRNVAYEYDRLNRVTSETSGGATQNHTYDPAGNRLTTDYGGGSDRSLGYSYDPMNRLAGIDDGGNITVTRMI